MVERDLTVRSSSLPPSSRQERPLLPLALPLPAPLLPHSPTPPAGEDSHRRTPSNPPRRTNIQLASSRIEGQTHIPPHRQRGTRKRRDTHKGGTRPEHEQTAEKEGEGTATERATHRGKRTHRRINPWHLIVPPFFCLPEVPALPLHDILFTKAPGIPCGNIDLL